MSRPGHRLAPASRALPRAGNGGHGRGQGPGPAGGGGASKDSDGGPSRTSRVGQFRTDWAGFGWGWARQPGDAKGGTGRSRLARAAGAAPRIKPQHAAPTPRACRGREGRQEQRPARAGAGLEDILLDCSCTCVTGAAEGGPEPRSGLGGAVVQEGAGRSRWANLHSPKTTPQGRPISRGVKAQSRQALDHSLKGCQRGGERAQVGLTSRGR